MEPRWHLCEACGEPFKTVRAHARTCSPACRQALSRKNHTASVIAIRATLDADHPTSLYFDTLRRVRRAAQACRERGAIGLAEPLELLADELNGYRPDTYKALHAALFGDPA